MTARPVCYASLAAQTAFAPAWLLRTFQSRLRSSAVLSPHRHDHVLQLDAVQQLRASKKNTGGLLKNVAETTKPDCQAYALCDK
ncbi:hypothetical protein LY78DRAFT_191527 [Colletotrichum sublineola]|nr:hypothetical protein LY78DRAFT_191527 [Colletotrichum sublineola]